MKNRVTLLYFARLREALGVGEEHLILPTDIKTVEHLLTWLKTRGQIWQATLSKGLIRVAVNQNLAGPNTPVTEGDEIAIFPPVTGG